jgi:hypothetical protein
LRMYARPEQARPGEQGPRGDGRPFGFAQGRLSSVRSSEARHLHAADKMGGPF